MSTLDTLRSERDALEQAGDYESGAYVWLVERIAELEAAEPANPPAPVPTTEPEATSPADRIAALQRDMREAALHPERLSDQQRHDLAARVNAEVRAALAEGSEPEPEAEDVGELGRQMAEALAKGNALDPDEAAAFSARFNTAVRHQVDHAAPAEELRALLAGNDLQARYEAAAELSRRGEVGDDVAARLVAEANGMAREAAAADPLDPERVPEAERELATRLRDQAAADEAELRGRVDPRDQLTSEVNALVRQASEAAREPLASVGAPSTEPTEGSPTQEA
jgi:hypothetical protein